MIVLLMEGEVRASGKHEHLMETSPEYVQIYDWTEKHQPLRKYTLNKSAAQRQQNAALGAALKRLAPLLADEKRLVASAFFAMLVTSGSSDRLVIVGRAVDTGIRNGNFRGVLVSAALLFVVYICGLLASYFATLAMGTVGPHGALQVTELTDSPSCRNCRWPSSTRTRPVT